MIEHPFLPDLTEITTEDLGEKISTLTNRMHWAFKMGKHDMTRQMQMVLEGYRAEYSRRQQELWQSRSNSKMEDKINIQKS